LNDEANFVEIPWAYLDEDGVKVTYLFRRNNELLVTKKGEVATGRWEYLPSMQSLLIEYVGKRRMYNQGFLDKAVLLLRKEGTEDFLALANMDLLPNLDIVEYLKTTSRPENTIPFDSKGISNKKNERLSYPITLSNGKIIHVWKTGRNPGKILVEGAKVTYENTNTPLPSGSYRIDGGDKISVKDGIIIRFQESSVGSFIILFFIFIILIAFILMSYN
jgi:hypothetical protein